MKKFLIYLLMFVLGLIIAGAIYVMGLKPQYAGTLKMSGLHDSVEVIFDDFGVPHIYAQNAEDAYMALGYVHAQDRLFQMEMMRRVAEGRLSEILGDDFVETDKFFRSLGMKAVVKSTIEHAFHPNDSVGKAALAYLAGVNRYIKKGKLPVEYTILGIPAETYDLEDMYMIAGYMAYSFQAGFRIDPLMSKIQSRLGDKYLKDIALDYVSGTKKIPVWTAADSIFAFADKVENVLQALPSPLLIGSNAWVVSGSKTRSGKVMLSNDTHIGYAQPSVWYDAHIEFPGQSFYGQFLAGIPFALLGHTRHTAWGITMFENDNLDMYREKRNPDNPNQVWFKDHWEDLKVVHEKIKVKGGKTVDFDVKFSRHGSLMNEVLANLDSAEQNPIAVWWEYTQFDSYLLQAFYKMNYSRDIRDIEKAAQLVHAPGLNIMAGDDKGNIAWWAAAKLFLRPEGVNGKLILDGASGKDEIVRFLDFSYNPHSVNPPSGYVFSANNQPDTINGVFHQGYYAPEDRAKRICEYLDSDRKWDMAGFHEMVTNTQSAVHPETAKFLLSFVDMDNLNETEKKAVEVLQNWKGEHLLASVAPTVFYRFLSRTLRNIFLDELGQYDYDKFAYTHLMERTYPPLFRNDSSLWWDDIHTPEKETRKVIINKSFKEAVSALVAQLGSNVDKWTWNRVHTIEHKHLIGRKKPFDKIFNVGPYPVKGGQQVLNNIDFRLTDDGLYRATYGPAIRNQIDFANVEDAESILPTGQSGRFMSKHYDDQAEMYNLGKFRKQMMNRKEIEEHKEGVLYFVPERTGGSTE